MVTPKVTEFLFPSLWSKEMYHFLHKQYCKSENPVLASSAPLERTAIIKARQYIHACDRLGFYYYLTSNGSPAFQEAPGWDWFAQYKRANHPGPELMVTALKELKRTRHETECGKHAGVMVFRKFLPGPFSDVVTNVEVAT